MEGLRSVHPPHLLESASVTPLQTEHQRKTNEQQGQTSTPRGNETVHDEWDARPKKELLRWGPGWTASNCSRPTYRPFNSVPRSSQGLWNTISGGFWIPTPSERGVSIGNLYFQAVNVGTIIYSSPGVSSLGRPTSLLCSNWSFGDFTVAEGHGLASRSASGCRER